ncbi:MAG: hypothetical protein RLZZ511_1184 [Cyanobacteriota bacterium]|jgi:major membrane immunogen (membrane-anchored lipoprotein)
MRLFDKQELKRLLVLAILFLATILTGCARSDFEGIATTPDGRILLLESIEREDQSDENYLYICDDVSDQTLRLNCRSKVGL